MARTAFAGPVGGRMDQRAIRQANLSTVLRRVAADRPRSRTTLALATGLNKTTVSSLVSELVASRWLVKTGDEEQPGAVGRPRRTVRLNGDAIAAVGLELNVDYLAACVTDVGGRVRHRERVEVDNAMTAPEPVLARLAQLARRSPMPAARWVSLSPRRSTCWTRRPSCSAAT